MWGGIYVGGHQYVCMCVHIITNPSLHTLSCWHNVQNALELDIAQLVCLQLILPMHAHAHGRTRQLTWKFFQLQNLSKTITHPMESLSVGSVSLTLSNSNKIHV